MTQPPPDLTTLGALLRFAISLEAQSADRYAEGATAPDAPPSFAELAAEHSTRVARLTRLLREQLNEMILEPISGLSVLDYTGGALDAAQLEGRLARLYADIVAKAGHLLPGATRTFTRFAERSRQLAS